jgi:hypothetical protein
VRSDTTVPATLLSHPERRLLENYPWLVVIMVVLFIVPREDAYVGNVGDWDWLLLSGVSIFMVVYPLSLLLPDRLPGCCGS